MRKRFLKRFTLSAIAVLVLAGGGVFFARSSTAEAILVTPAGQAFLDGISNAATGVYKFLFDPVYLEDEAADALDEAAAVDTVPRPEVPTYDLKTESAVKKNTDAIDKASEDEDNRDLNYRLERIAERNKNLAAAVAFKQALHYFLNNIAYETATWITSGDEGQQPVFYTEGWGAYLASKADNAAGLFLEQLDNNLELGLGLCEPSFGLKLRVTLGLPGVKKTLTPECSLSEIVGNWEEYITRGDFLDDFTATFDPRGNDLGIALNIHLQYRADIQKEVNAAEKDREEGDGSKGVLSKISNFIRTPSQTVLNAINTNITEDWGQAETVYTGEIVADAINTFVSTLAGNLLQRAFKEGLALLRGEDDSRRFAYSSGYTDTDSDLYDPGSSGTSQLGRQAAQGRFIDFLYAGTQSGGPYQLTQQLVTCSDPANPGPDECVFDEQFRLAVEQQLTLRQAIDNNLIDGNAPFGFTGYNEQPNYKEGYPYRSLLIMRTHRIIPVTWELAAEAINKMYNNEIPSVTNGENFTLNRLIDLYDDPASPFYQLIDDSWVLKAPEAYCALEGYGETVVSDSVVNNERLISRDTYCADYQSCIQKDINGNCIYGHCTEERGVWDLQAQSCPEQFATCQTFESRTGTVASYLQNSLEYNGCTIDNVGCQWYCQDYNIVNGTWTCLDDQERVLKACELTGGCPLTSGCQIAEGQSACVDSTSGVTLTLAQPCAEGSQWWSDNPTQDFCEVSTGCTVPKGGVSCSISGCEAYSNLVLNSGFETARPATPPTGGRYYVAQNWSTDQTGTAFFSRVQGATERIYAGNSSLRFYSVGAAIQQTQLVSDEIILPVGEYTLSGLGYNNLNAGTLMVWVRVNAANGSSYRHSREISATGTRNTWQSLSDDFTIRDNNLDRDTNGDGIMDAVGVSIVISASGNQVSGSAWFDNFYISQSCLVDPVTLTLSGTVGKDQSKIHFDRDVDSCSSEDDGCSEFVRLKENLGTNIVRNSSFEEWPADERLPVNWEQNLTTASIVRVEDDAVVGSQSIAFNAGVPNCPDTGTCQSIIKTEVPFVQPGTGYYVSFWAKANQELSRGTAVTLTWIDTNLPDSDPQRIRYHNFSINNTVEQSLDEQWRRFVFDPFILPGTAGPSTVALHLWAYDPDAMVFVDGVQLEAADFNGSYSNYSEYAQSNTINIRKAPNYLSCQGYTLERPSPYVLEGVSQSQCSGETLVWRPDSCVGGDCCHEIDPGECFDYAMYCQADEVGCQAYSPLTGGPTIPGVVSYDDYCPLECVGYATYRQAPSFFENQETLEFFIPDTAEQCSAAQAGCDEFTNIDAVGQGGEDRLYFTEIRHCAKPSESSCQNFFSWQGSDDSGYQLQVYNLVVENSEPKYAIAEGDAQSWPDRWGDPQSCDGPEDIATNPFCREFYGSDGQIHYRIMNNTITCSDSCIPLRKTRYNESEQTARDNCAISNPAYIEGVTDESNPGWEQGSCVYYAIPGEGQSCSAQFAGCRAYRGNTSSNVYTAFTETFERGTNQGWRTGTISSEALSVGGHSLVSTGSSDGQTAQTFVALMNNQHNGDWRDSGTVVCDPDTTPVCDDSGSLPCYDQQFNYCIAQADTETQRCAVAVGDSGCSHLQGVFQSNKAYIISFWAKSSVLSDSIGASVRYQPGGDGYMAKDIPSNADYQDYGRLTGIQVNNSWQYYEYGPVTFNDINSLVVLGFGSGGGETFYIDNIEITETTDYVHVIKDSWETPLSCDTNPYLDPPIASPQYMLGCQQYSDKTGAIHNLKSFTSLCREQAIGCEALIDTHNSDSPYAEEFNINDPVSNVVVPADEVVYLTNRDEFECSSTVQGCQLVGDPTVNAEGVVVGYTDRYLINDPDQYSAILCANEEVGCEEFQSNDGFAYFKDPGDKTCQYRQIPNQSGYGWFKTGSTSTIPDCPLVSSPTGLIHPSTGWAGVCSQQFDGCTEFIDPVSDIAQNILFNADMRQDVDGNSVPDGWRYEFGGAGMVQEIFLKRGTMYTYSFDVVNPGGTFLDNLRMRVDSPGLVSLDTSMAHEITYAGVCSNDPGRRCTDGNVTNDCGSSSASCVQTEFAGSCLGARGYACDVDSDCNQSSGVCTSYVLGFNSSLYADTPTGKRVTLSGRFYVPELYTDESLLSFFMANRSQFSQTLDQFKQVVQNISIRETGVYYALGNEVDRFSCNGIVDPDNNCVLFNDRNEMNYKLGDSDTSYLLFDADQSGPTVNGGVPVTTCNGPCDSNTVLKVKPDRVCGEWLECATTLKDTSSAGRDTDYCLDVAVCNQLDEEGNCTNYVSDYRLLTAGLPNQTALSGQELANVSGYTTAGLTLGGNSVAREGYYHYGLMSQEGDLAFVPNGGFESYYVTGKPVGWRYPSKANQPVQWRPSIFVAVANDVIAETGEGVTIDDGRSVLRLSASSDVYGDPFSAVTEPFEISKNTSYNFTGTVNTLNLKPAEAEAYLYLEGRQSGSGNTFSVLPDSVIKVRAGVDWQTRLLSFNSGQYDEVRVRLTHINGPRFDQCTTDTNGDGLCDLEGTSYFDQIGITPALLVQTGRTTIDNDGDGSPDSRSLIAPSCRLYPTSDAQSCDYLDDSSVVSVGLEGYCMLHDPSNPSVCLQWYPIDLVKGDFLDQFRGYQNRVPQYYCTEMKSAEPFLAGNLEGSVKKQNIFNSTWYPPAQFRQPSYIKVTDATGKGSYHFSDKMYLTPSNNFEIGWIGESAMRNNMWYNDYNLYGRGQGNCQPGQTSVVIDNVVYPCEDNSSTASVQYPASPGSTGGWNSKLPDRLIEQAKRVQNNQPAFGKDGTVWDGARRAEEAVKDWNYCNRNYDWGMDDAKDNDGCGSGDCETKKKSILWMKANFSDLGILESVDYGVCDDTSEGSGFNWQLEFYYNYCSELVEVVTPSGQNKAWFSRLTPGSDYVVPTLGYTYGQDYNPYGAIVYPLPVDDPSLWDAKDDEADNPRSADDDELYLGNQPLFIEAPQVNDYDTPYQARAGSPYSCAEEGTCFLPGNSQVNLFGPNNQAAVAERLKRLFAKSYSVWRWNKNSTGIEAGQERICAYGTPNQNQRCNVDANCFQAGDEVRTGACELRSPQYQEVVDQNLLWSTPVQQCAGNIRPSEFNPGACAAGDSACDYCGVAPQVTNMSINGQGSGQISIINPRGTAEVTLRFNGSVDGSQLPLNRLVIDWGDGSETTFAGQLLRDRSNPDEPYQFTHAYSYFNLLQQDREEQQGILPGNRIFCQANASLGAPNWYAVGGFPALRPGECVIQPRVKLVDNWGWCNAERDSLGNPETPGVYGYTGEDCTTRDLAWTSFGGYITVGSSL